MPAAAAALVVAAVVAPELVPYDLRPGDHLVYRESLSRHVQGPRTESVSQLEWDAHLLVLSAGDGYVLVGIQRNRTRAELSRYRERGADRLEAGRQELAEALARRGPSFAEANWLTPRGVALLPWSAAREASSERLALVHEIEPLPEPPATPGGAFRSRGLMAVPLRFTGTEAVAGEECQRFEGGASAGGALKLRQWHCNGSRTLGRLEYEARYDAPGAADVSERYRLQKLTQSRQQTLESWLQDRATAQGALAALVASERLSAPRALAEQALLSDEPETQRLALAVLWRHRLAPPPLERLRALVASPSPRVRTLAVRLLALRPEPEAAALRAAAAADADGFVRAAARRAEVPPEALLRLAMAVRGEGPLPAWTGPLEPGLGRRLLLSQRAAGQVAGTTLRFMQDPRFGGWPYVLHVPEDYRGDEPFPLVVVLGGGAGRALGAAQTAWLELRERGQLVVFPQANGLWWDEPAGEAFAALLGELLRTLDVDTDRVTITGYSNGGTGTVLYASRMPDRFAAYASLEGAGLPFFADSQPIEPLALARLPALFLHGSRDEIIPAEASERTVAALRRAEPQAKVELHLLPGRGHDVFYGRDEGRSFRFLEAAAREAFPRQVVLRASRPQYSRAFWVEVLQKGGGTAEVDGTIEGQQIALRSRGVKRLRLRLRRELLDLSLPLRVSLNGREAFQGPLAEDPALFLRSWRETADPQLAYSAELLLDVR